MSKTKEEIFDEKVGEHHRLLSPANYADVVQAMDEFAKQQVIAFANWITQEKCTLAIMYGDQPDRFCDEEREYTSEQVYDLFLQSNSLVK